MKTLIAVLFAATSGFAQPVITSISPASWPAEGGAVVTIKGSGFHDCLFCNPRVPVPVLFGETVSRATVVDANTIRVVAPPHLPGTVDVSVWQDDGKAMLPRAFTYTGTIEENFDRVLLPLFLPEVQGAFGSRFVTQLRVANTSTSAVANVIGLNAFCFLPACPPPRAEGSLYEIFPGQSIDPQDLEYTGKPGAFVYVPSTSPEPTFNLRVFDASRSMFNFGTELPVVHQREFTTGPIRLLGVPLGPLFRNTLRVYAIAATSVSVKIGDQTHHVVVPGGDTPFAPAYAQFAVFPAGTGTIDVTITPSTVTPPMPGLAPPAVWAFISVTNNDTQLITTISPQR